MTATRRTGRDQISRVVLAAVGLLLLFPLVDSTPSAAQVGQPELGFDAEVHPHGDPLGPSEKGHVVIDVVITCEAPGIFTGPTTIMFYFQTWPSFGIEVRPKSVETEVDFSPEECIVTNSTRSIVLEPEFSFTHGFDDPVKIELAAHHEGQSEIVAYWHEPPGIHADWETSFEQRGTIMVDTLIQMRGQVENTGNVPLDVELVVQDPPRYGRLDHPERLTMPTSSEGGSTQTLHLEYRADRIGHETFTLLLRAKTADGAQYTLEPHLSRMSFDIVERQRASDAVLDDPEGSLPTGTIVLLVIAAGAIALLVWRKNHRHPVYEKTIEPLNDAVPAPPAGPPDNDLTEAPETPGSFHVKEIRAPTRWS